MGKLIRNSARKIYNETRALSMAVVATPFLLPSFFINGKSIKSNLKPWNKAYLKGELKYEK